MGQQATKDSSSPYAELADDNSFLDELKHNFTVKPAYTAKLPVLMRFWAMNSAASYVTPPGDNQPQREILFVATTNRILCFDCADIKNAQPGQEIPCIKRLDDVFKNDQQDEIDSIRLLHIAGVPSLVVACNSGNVFIYTVEDIDRPPIRLRNDESTWGIAGHNDIPAVFVSANSFNITMFNLDTTNPATDFKRFSGHQHNIPFIDVSPCGEFLASVSIDGASSIWHIPTQTRVKKGRLEQWGWGCIWIRKSDVLDFQPMDRVTKLLQGPSPVKDPQKYGEMDASQESSSMQIPDVNDDSEDMEIGDEWLSDEDMGDESGSDSDSDNDSTDTAQIALQILNHLQQPQSQPEIKSSQNWITPVFTPNLDSSVPQAPYLRKVPLSSVVQTTQSSSLSSSLQTPSITPTVQILDKMKDLSEDQIRHRLNEAPYLLVCTTFNTVFLFDTSYNCLAQVSEVLPSLAEPTSYLSSLERLSLLFYIPELSLLVLGSQGCCAVVLVTIRRNVFTMQYELIPRMRLHNSRSALSGLTLSKHVDPACPDKYWYRLHMLHQLGHLYAYDIYPEASNL